MAKVIMLKDDEAALVLTAELSAIHTSPSRGFVHDLGVISRRCVTTAFCNMITDILVNGASSLFYTKAQPGGGSAGDFLQFPYHRTGTGTTAENVEDDDVETLAADEATADSIAVGTSNNIMVSTATVVYDNTYNITEHVVANWSIHTEYSGEPCVTLDRSVFSAIPVILNDSVQYIYKLTLTAGS